MIIPGNYWRVNSQKFSFRSNSSSFDIYSLIPLKMKVTCEKYNNDFLISLFDELKIYTV